MVPSKMVRGHLTPLLMLRNATQEVSLYGKQTTTKAATIVDNFLITEEGIPKIYLIFISPPGLKSHHICLYHVTLSGKIWINFSLTQVGN